MSCEATDGMAGTITSFLVPGNPIAKGRPRRGRGGVMYTPQRTVNNEAFIKLIAVQSMADREPTGCAVVVDIAFVFAVPKSTKASKAKQMMEGEEPPIKKPDIDNIVKSVLDACNCVAWVDDRQVVGVYMTKHYGSYAGTYVSVKRWEEFKDVHNQRVGRLAQAVHDQRMENDQRRKDQSDKSRARLESKRRGSGTDQA